MSGYLLDTNVALLAVTDPAVLSSPTRSAIRTGSNTLSVVVYWEVVLKSLKGSLSVGDPRSWWLDALEVLLAAPLALRPKHVSALCDLPPIHRDPFDRILVAQAAAESLTLLTTDRALMRYASPNVRVIT